MEALLLYGKSCKFKKL